MESLPRCLCKDCAKKLRYIPYFFPVAWAAMLCEECGKAEGGPYEKDPWAPDEKST
jgi:C4-type Zn-finger protein